MDIQVNNTDILTNFRGTTCKSFTIGRTAISFASNAIVSSTLEDLSEYKTLVVRNSADNRKKIIYDMEINARSIKYVSEEANGLTCLHLMNGNEIMIKGSTSGVESDVTSDDPSKPGEIVTFADTSGKVITKSGFVFANAASFPGATMDVSTLEDLHTLIALYMEDPDLDKKVPTMKAVIDYVGAIDKILEMRINGSLPIN